MVERENLTGVVPFKPLSHRIDLVKLPIDANHPLDAIIWMSIKNYPCKLVCDNTSPPPTVGKKYRTTWSKTIPVHRRRASSRFEQPNLNFNRARAPFQAPPKGASCSSLSTGVNMYGGKYLLVAAMSLIYTEWCDFYAAGAFKKLDGFKVYRLEQERWRRRCRC